MALAAADAAGVVTQDAEAVFLEHLVQHDRDRVLHRAAGLRMRMEDQRDRGAFIRRFGVTRFDTALGARNDEFGHDNLGISA